MQFPADLLYSSDHEWIAIADGRARIGITDYAQDVKACALGQAAASLVGSSIVGLTLAQVQTGRDAVLTMLKEGGPAPAAPFTGFDVLEPAREYKNRHASIMLAFDATLDALAQASAAKTA